MAARCDDMVIVSCYCSPNADLDSFLKLLDGLESLLDGSSGFPVGAPKRVLMCGDFNSKSA